MRTRSRTAARLPVALLAFAALAAAGASACDVQRAVDCARLALAVTESAVEVEQAAATDSVQDDAEALDELARDIDALESQADDTDVRQAAGSVLDAAENITEATEQGGVPDLSPLQDATAELTSVCAAADGGEG